MSLPRDVVDAARQNLATQFANYVNPGGLLNTAFYTAKENLPWFNTSAHKLVVSSMQSILQAYKVQLMYWQAIAFRRRAKNDISGYNKAQLEVITLLSRVPHLMLELQNAVKQKISDLKQARQNGLTRADDHRDRSDLTEHRKNRPDPYYTAMWVLDPASKRSVLRAELKATTTGQKWGDAGKFIGG